MFDTNSIKLGSNSQSITLNTPSTGMMQRSHSKSAFVRFQKGSEMEKRIFPMDASNPIVIRNGCDIEIVVLQISIFGDNYYLVEIVEASFLKEE